MKNRNSIFTTSILVLAGFSLSPVAQARQQSEDRGNGNSAAENVDALNLSTTGATTPRTVGFRSLVTRPAHPTPLMVSKHSLATL